MTPQPHASPTPTAAPRGTLIALALVTCLFFMWGLSYGLLDVLNKHFQDTLSLGKAQSALLQAAYFGAYFVVAIPAAMFMEKVGYKPGILVGLGLFAVGALLFIPASGAASFPFFLFALFVLASGLGCLETAANPYATVLGSPETAARRLNLVQAFNGLGSFVGPLIGGTFFFTAAETAGQAVSTNHGFDGVRITYIAIAIVVLLLALLIWRVPMPDIRERNDQDGAGDDTPPLARQRHFRNGVLTLFVYVGAQVGLGAFFINYALSHWGKMTPSDASYFLSIAMLCYMLGRFLSTSLMRFIAPRKLLALYGAINVILMGIVVTGIPVVSVIALIAAFFFMSIMFPTIFALSIEHLGARTKRGSSYLIMAIMGGAIAPYLMGSIADHATIEAAFWLPMAAFAVVVWFGWKGCVVRTSQH